MHGQQLILLHSAVDYDKMCIFTLLVSNKNVSAKVFATISAREKRASQTVSILSENVLCYFEKLHEIEQITTRPGSSGME